MFKRSILLAGAMALLAVSSARAQHANFVLFGKPNPEAANVAAEQKFVHPLTTPYYAEDSFVTTDLRAWFAYHSFDSGGIINGGDAQVYAAQIRIALTDKLQLVAYKDGFVNIDTGFTSTSGWNDIAAGLKYNFIQDWKSQLHASAGVGGELPVGDSKVLQNYSELRFWGSVNKGWDKFHLGGDVNVLIGGSKNNDLGHSDRIIWNLHADYYINEFVSPVIELNGFHTINDSHQVVEMNGLDITNLGGGESVVTLGVGAEVRPAKNIGLRGAFEFPIVNEDNGLFGTRVTLSAVVSF